MGVVIRPPEFARGIASARLVPIRTPIRDLRAGRFDVRIAALVVALMAVAWMLALAGAAFAVRALLVLFFATLAGRARRVGVPARQAIGIRRGRQR